ncbi:CU044_5270 family protein [Streptomyces sp. NPDC005181]|uniref:CU044_5270 family protein n=1 Tax=Streptomyces sp. NPDC005181 TaxID=3156869 RepID=UPI0033B5A90E
MSQDPTAVTNIGMIRESGKGVPMSGQDLAIETAGADGSDDTGAIGPGIQRPTYKWLASLPTDPDALLELLYAQTRVDRGESKDQAVFEQIGTLLDETIMPPRNSAALYKAVAKIPGVIQSPDAVDAAGRHGIGITREDAASATRSEWIFDSRSFEYLGSRSYITKAGKGTRPTTLFGSNAILRRAVVDQRGLELTDAAR